MAKIALITDTHFGIRNDSLLFHDAFVKFYDEVFFPELQRRNICTVVHLGDVFDRRKYINFHILHRTRVDFLEKLVAGKFDTHIIIGNHDTFFRDSNDINSVAELIHLRYPNFHVYEEPQEVVFDKLRVLMIPWLNPTNMPVGLDMIANSKASVLFGHLEIAGFHMDQTQICEHGIDRDIFKRYKKVFSGHFHHASEDGPIRYLGPPYEFTFADLNDAKGFYIFDTESLELEFIYNPNRMFYRIVYDDRENKEELLQMDFSEYENKFVRLIVPHKTDPVLYEQWVDRLIHVNPADLQISEQFSLEVSEDADEQFLEFDENNQIVVVSDTLTVLNKYVDAIGMDVDKTRIKEIMKELYLSATTGM